MKFIYDDGGRAAAGYSGTAGDCVCRAVAIATGRPYFMVHAELRKIGWGERRIFRDEDGLYRSRSDTRYTLREYMNDIGWRWVPIMKIGSGCTVHLRTGELPPAPRLIARVTRHWVAVIHGVIRDTHDPSRGGMRCVYGYFIPQKGE